MMRSHCSTLSKQPCLIIAKSGNDQKEYINGENIFRLVDNYIKEKHGTKEKNVIINGFSKYFLKRNGNIEN